MPVQILDWHFFIFLIFLLGLLHLDVSPKWLSTLSKPSSLTEHNFWFQEDLSGSRTIRIFFPCGVGYSRVPQYILFGTVPKLIKTSRSCRFIIKATYPNADPSFSLRRIHFSPIDPCRPLRLLY
jgi:hypothetical protein